MGDDNLVVFAKQCCELGCSQPAWKSLRLYDGDDGKSAGRKWFCNEHYPAPDQPLDMKAAR